MGNADEPVFFCVLTNTATDAKGSKPVPVKMIVHEKLIITVMFSVLADGMKLTCTLHQYRQKLNLHGNFYVSLQYQILKSHR
jgi:hypothetical protein